MKRLMLVVLMVAASLFVVPPAYAAPPPPAGYTTSDLIWSDTFDGTTLNRAHWNPYMTNAAASGGRWNASRVPAGCSAMNTPGGNYSSYECPGQITVNNGLTLNMKPDKTVAGYTARGAAITSYSHFALTSGYVQFGVNLPDSSFGGWPAIWFISNTAQRGEIDLDEGGFTPKNAGLPLTTPQNNVFISHYHDPVLGWQRAAYDAGNLTSGYHVYGMEYLPGVSIKTFIDGHLVGSWTRNVNTDPYEIIVNTDQASSATCCWHTQGTEPSTAMHLTAVEVYQH